MCVVLVKPSGVGLPDNNRLRDMFESNDDGAGFMFIRDKKVVIKKGFMKFKALKRAIREAEIDDQDCVVIHFRIATSGSVSPGNCHPFPVSDSVKDLKKLSLETDIAIAHNGVLKYPNDKKLDLSDTASFVKDIMAGSRIKKNLFDPSVFSLLEMSIGTSKIVILDGKKNQFSLLGDWFEDPTTKDGCYYSNLYFTWRNRSTYHGGAANQYRNEQRTNNTTSAQATTPIIELPYTSQGRSDDASIPAWIRDDEERAALITDRHGEVGQYPDSEVYVPVDGYCPRCGTMEDNEKFWCTKCGVMLYREEHWH
jgi:hypothetical protein